MAEAVINVEREVDRSLLRNKIRASGFTQLEVQEALGWGRSYISQFLTKQKKLRLEQVLSILNVIEVEPAAFFGELYGAPPWSDAEGLQARNVSAELPHHQLARVRSPMAWLICSSRRSSSQPRGSPQQSKLRSRSRREDQTRTAPEQVPGQTDRRLDRLRAVFSLRGQPAGAFGAGWSSEARVRSFPARVMRHGMTR